MKDNNKNKSHNKHNSHNEHKNQFNQTYSYKPGRNDPCPCGSGKKYKNCCLGKTEAINLSNYKYDKYLETRQSATVKLIDIGINELKLEEQEAAYYILSFLSYKPDINVKLRDEHVFENFLRESSALFLAYGYPIFETSIDIEDEKKDIEVDEFGFDFINTGDVNDNYLWKYCLKNHSNKFNASEKRFLESFSQSVNGFFRVLGIIDKNAQDNFSNGDYPLVEVQDIFTKKKYKIMDRKLSEGVVKHDLISGSLVPYDTYTENTPLKNLSSLSLYIIEGSPPLLYPYKDEPLVTEIAKEYCRTFRKQYKNLFDKKIDYSKILKEFPAVIYLAATNYFYYIITRPLPRMVNYDKEELVISTSTFKVGNREELKNKLLKISGIRIVEETRKKATFHWYNEKNTILGTIVLKEKTLKFDTNSLERLERFRKKIRGLPMEFEKTDYTHMQDIMEQSSKDRVKTAGNKKAKTGQKLKIPEDELEKFALKWWEDYYNDWVKTKISAIGNITPLEAVKTKEGIKKVQALIDDYENSYLRNAKKHDDSGSGINIQKYFNPEEMRKRLGLD